jgi:hypothetical protein
LRVIFGSRVVNFARATAAALSRRGEDRCAMSSHRIATERRATVPWKPALVAFDQLFKACIPARNQSHQADVLASSRIAPYFGIGH